MQTYIVKLLFNISIDNGNDRSQFDEQTRIIKSWSAEDAFHKARAIGYKEDETFVNTENKLVSWQFVDVTEVYPMEDYKDGDQIFSNSRQEKDHQSYITFIKQKAMEVQIKNLTFA